MTDAAVIADSAPAPDVPAGGAAINENAPQFNSPLGSQVPPDSQAENQPQPKEPRSISDSIDRAFERSAAKDAEKAREAKPVPKVEAKAEVKPEPAKPAQERGEGGKFVAKDAPAAKPAPEPAKPSFTASDAPSRFADDAKKDWLAAPESVRRESERAIKELTDGFQKYKSKAERDDTLAEFHEEAKQAGKELHAVVREYRNMEKLLNSNPAAGIEQILNRVGLTPRQYAEHILNQTPDQQASQQDATISELRRHNQALEQRLNALEGGFEEQREQSTLTEVTKFAADHPRFDELADDIAFLMKSGRAKDLPEAYELAERLNPAPVKAPEPAASSAAPPEPPVQPDKGSKSINGAPSTGLTSRRKSGPAPSIDEALNRAFGQAG